MHGNVIDRFMLPIHNTPSNALELEAAIVERFRDPEVMYELQFWTTDQCLVAPASLKKLPRYNQACAELEAIGWPVVVRKTGGGVTPQGNGILNVSIAYALDPVETPTIHGVYQMFCAPLLQFLESLGCHANTAFVPGSFCDGEYNIVVDNRKVMGTAQRWTHIRALESRQIVFAHALILLDANLDAGIQAINHLYRACEMEMNINVDVHANLKQLVGNENPLIEQQQVINRLQELYRVELTALTE